MSSPPLLQIFCSCQRLYIYDPRDREEACSALTEDHRHWVIGDAQRLVSDCDPARPEGVIIEKSAHSIPGATRKRTEKTVKAAAVQKNSVIVPKLLPDHFGKKLVLVRESTAAKKANTLKRGTEEKNEEKLRSRGEEVPDDKEVVLHPSNLEEQAPFKHYV